jgi:exodeoxyribonuclease V gamma subunit
MKTPNPGAVDAPLPHGFMVLHGNRLEDLRDLLLDYLRQHPLPPLSPELILLQSNGMKHWLELALADDQGLGICAATRMELPSSYLWQVYRTVLGPDAVPEHMPFDKTALLWRLVRLLPVLCETNPVYTPLKRYLAGANPARKLYQLALQLADVLDGYQSYRADWLADWATGLDQLRGPHGASEVLPPEQAWQAQLWRDIRADVGEALMEASRASVHEAFLRKLDQLKHAGPAGGAVLAALPLRLIVFGISSLSMQAVQALAALGQVCQVLMLVQNPCQYYWGDLVEGHTALKAQLRRRQSAKVLPAAAEPPAATHPLLASWGKQGRDYLHLLDGFDAPEAYRAHWSRVDLFVDPAGPDQPAPSQLAQLQSAILNLSPPPPAPLLQDNDGSLVFVTTHSAQRELEVLHDQLLAWLDADPDLLPRQVMVMVPDMEAFAPHIHAVFGRFTSGQPRHIPYSVADTTARQSPLVQALEQLLNLPNARLTLAEWLSLFEVAAVRTRFQLDEAAVRQLQDWLAAAGVRWGLDAAHRLAWGLPAGAVGLAQNTWAFGLRRLLLGYALGSASSTGAGDDADLTDGAIWCDTLAQPALSGLDAPLAAGLLGWISAIEASLPALQGEHTPVEWGEILQDLVERFFAPADEQDERAITRLLAPLDLWLQACADASLDSPLPLDVVREHWLSTLAEEGLQQRFFGGGVQFGTLMPMRSIPFKHICLLGMNDGAYPRVQAARDFDLMASSWRAGDRSRREDDRYLFLEALLSARQRLYISWQGRSAADNSLRPPSVLVAQLLDHVNQCWAPQHQPQPQPLQPFSEAYFVTGSPYMTFDTDWQRLRLPAAGLLGAAADEAVPASATAANSILASASAAPPSTLSLGELQRLLRQPVEVFFRSRLQVDFDSLEDLEQEDEPFALNHLQQHQAGAALLLAAGSDPGLARLRASGSLPLAGFGSRVAESLLAKVDTVLQSRSVWLQDFPQALAALPIELWLAGGDEGRPTQALTQDEAQGAPDAQATLPTGWTLTGTLSGLWSQGGHDPQAACLQLAERTGAVLQGKGAGLAARPHVLVGLWLRHLAASASGLLVTSVQLGVDGQVVFRPLAADAALAILSRLAQAHAQAWARPLPVACKTGWAWLLAQRNNQTLLAAGKPAKDPHELTRETFEGGQRGGERAESAYLQRAFTGYDALAADLPQWAPWLYGDMLAHAEVSSGVSA